MPRLNPATGFLLSLLPYGLVLAMPGTPSKPPAEPVSFRKSIEPLFKSQCISCHQPGNAQGGLDLTTAAAIRKGGVSGSMLTPKNSILVQRLRGEGGKPRMPMGFAPVSDATIRQIESWVSAGAPLPDPEIRFDRDIAPLFKANCSSCHTGATASAGLDLSSAAGIAKGGASGALFNFQSPAQSLLLQRLRGEGGKPRMPMGFAPLDDASMDKLRRWIAGGAETTDDGEHRHWAFVSPTRPSVPKPKRADWVRNPVDAFVLEKLEGKGWSPATAAGKETLVRRVYLDLLGLPPTPAEIDAFLSDRRPDAYERLVDRLLASPHFGEHMARKWLDLARYADSDGFEKDLQRTAWLYRDWVIDAFNRDLPYDQFVVDQMAGDLIRHGTAAQKIATGFHRNTMQNLEGGVDQEEAHFAKLVDRVGTTATVFNGLTMACAQCHDHKYDPLSHKDYFKFMAFFANTRIVKRGDASVSEEKWVEPEIPVPTAEQNAKLTQLRATLARLEESLAAPVNETAYADWRAAISSPGWSPVAVSGMGLEAVDTDLRATGPTPNQTEYVLSGNASSPITGFKLTVVPDPNMPNAGSGRSPSGNFILSDLKVTAGKPMPITELAASHTQNGFDVRGVLDTNPDTGWAIAPHFRAGHHLIIELAESIPAGASYSITMGMRSTQWPQHVLGRFKLEAIDRPHPAQYVIPMGFNLSDETALRKRYAEAAPERRKLVAQQKAIQSERSQIERQVPTAMVLEENRQGIPRIQFRERGEFLQRGPWMTANTPEVLPPMKEGLPKNRLGLARWLTHPEHPLTARVQVNRLWEHIFGRGIVETSENFGTQATPPSHPELLDWLATEFVRKKWSNKQMLRLLVTSATYRQSPVTSAKIRAADPNNEWLARAPRYRLDAETLRDNALRISGLLNPKVGGPSVFPVQPEGIWNTPYSGERWMTAQDGDRYRRGIYTFMKRTAPYPSFMAFDATSREQCTVRRTRTNTPLQALAMLNDPAYLEAARALSGHLAKVGTDPGARIVEGFRRCTGRRPTAAEKARLVKLVSDVRQRYQRDPESAKKLAATPEQAAWVMVANVLLNLDETLNKE
jgi:mono/diheme cytochrome c family protein